MMEFLPKELREGLEAARLRALKKRARLRLVQEAESFPVLRLWHDGLSLDADHTAHLRGLVDIYDGGRQVMQALIIASNVEAGELICEFKRVTPVSDRPALDFWRGENAPVAYLPKA